MIKSELVQRIAEHNPHLYQRDVENIVNAILEDVLGPIMFEIPSADDVAKVVVTRDAVVDGAAPTVVLREARKSA